MAETKFDRKPKVSATTKYLRIGDFRVESIDYFRFDRREWKERSNSKVPLARSVKKPVNGLNTTKDS
jgi:hypothetical protein